MTYMKFMNWVLSIRFGSLGTCGRWRLSLDNSILELLDVPAHLGTDGNLNSVVDKLGLVHEFDATVGKIWVDIDISKPLHFSRNKKSKDGEIKYEMLFKQYLYCALITN